MTWLLFCSIFVISAYALPPPSYIKPCSVKDNFEKCALEHGIAAIPSLSKGDKKYGIPSIAPFKLPRIEISPGDRLKLNLTDITVQGLDKAVLKDIKYSHDKRHMKFSVAIEDLSLNGNYDINGMILVLPITGKGPFTLSVYGGTYIYDFDIKSETKDGVNYGKISNDVLDFELTKSSLNFENLFNGDPTLGPQMNKFLNENSKEVIMDLKGAITQSIAAICRTILQNYFSKTPLKDLILE